MTTSPQQSNQEAAQEKPNDKELNFRKQEAMYQKMLEEERAARIAAEKRASERMNQKVEDDDDNDDEPYVDRRSLQKKLSRFEKDLEEKIDKKAQQRASELLQNEKRQQWLKNNPDFEQVLNTYAQKFAEKDPELAESILEMPDTFERQKLVYKNIKALGLDKKEEAKPSIQETIDKNRRGAFYQPSGMGSPPYAMAGDFSATGQKTAYDKMKELQKRLRG